MVSNLDRVNELSQKYTDIARKIVSGLIAMRNHDIPMQLPEMFDEWIKEAEVAREAWYNEPFTK
jgi:hypothetical protein